MPHQRTMNVDITTKEVEGFNLGDEVTATVTGEIVELTAENAYGPFESCCNGKEEDDPPSVTLKVAGVKLNPAKKNEFGKMADEDEKEGD